MDDQNKRNDDLFGFRYGRDDASEKMNETQGETKAAESASSDEETIFRPHRPGSYGTSSATTKYNGYSGYGASDGSPNHRDANESSSPSSNVYTYGPFAGSSQSGGGDGGDKPELVPVTRDYRPFTVSGGRNWEAPPQKRRRSPFLAIFASFMVGVLVVGGLMFSADRYNWFGGDQALTAATGTTSSPSPSAQSGSTVSNVADTTRPDNISAIFEQASPAVVKIETYASSRSGSNNFWMDDPFFRQFFGDEQDSQGGQGSDSLQQTGTGSGFFFDSTGYILTNEHVIEGATEIKVTVQGFEEPFTAELLGSSYDLDLAVLKIEGSNFPTLKLGDSNALNMGDWVVAIGNPYGFDHTVTVGVLSSNEREISIQDTNGTRNYEHLLQTDASINPGNSGGPLINMNGEVIGINTAVSSEAQGIGFAIPTSTISEVLENLKTNTEIPKEPIPYIGANLQALTESTARQLGLSSTDGSLVYNVLYNTPAYNGDLRQYDVIVGIDGTKYNTPDELTDAIRAKNVGDKVTLNVIRGGKEIDLTVTIGDKNEYDASQQTEE
ncbi:S1C family serine protease [Cohnella massiliensis]|uniref:S1C family serine protease n=1 Tax=Cohnella massiliensis TaxID=1816691 RepID=UPI0009B9BDDC|nr:trypsin-like peptidase domain-containing protein [Cohnella massiliensis]